MEILLMLPPNFRDRHRPLFQLCNTVLAIPSSLDPSFIFDGFLAPIDLNKETERGREGRAKTRTKIDARTELTN